MTGPHPDRTARADRADQVAIAAGMLTVALVAAVQSFDHLTGLAQLGGVTDSLGPVRLRWLFPLGLDVYAAVAVRMWLRSGRTPATRAHAKRGALAAICLSVAGNITHVVMTVHGPRVLVAVAVAALPPILLGFVGQLHARHSADRTAEQTAAEAAAQRRADRHARTGPDRTDTGPVRTTAPGPDRSAVPDQTGPALTDEQAMATIHEAVRTGQLELSDGKPSRRGITALTGAGASRAARLRDQFEARPHLVEAAS